MKILQLVDFISFHQHHSKNPVNICFQNVSGRYVYCINIPNPEQISDISFLATVWNQSPFLQIHCWVNADVHDNRRQTFLTHHRGTILLGVRGNALNAINRGSNAWSHAIRSSLFMIKMFVFNDHCYMFFKRLKNVKRLTAAQRIICITFIIRMFHSKQFRKICLI